MCGGCAGVVLEADEYVCVDVVVVSVVFFDEWFVDDVCVVEVFRLRENGVPCSAESECDVSVDEVRASESCVGVGLVVA